MSRRVGGLAAPEWGGSAATLRWVRNGWLAVVLAVGGCEPARPADPDAVCPSDPKKAESLGCGVFRALAAGNETGYLPLVMTARADVEAAMPPFDHAPTPPDQEAEARAREEAADEFHMFLEELEVRGIAPVSLQLRAIDARRAGMRGDVGFAEEIDVQVQAGKQVLTITLDDCFFVRGRWLVSDGLRLDGRRIGP